MLLGLSLLLVKTSWAKGVVLLFAVITILSISDCFWCSKPYRKLILMVIGKLNSFKVEDQSSKGGGGKPVIKTAVL